MSFDRTQSRASSVLKDTRYYEVANFTEHIWNVHCKRLDDLWKTLAREDAQIRECTHYVECSIFGTSGESHIILPELRNNLDNVKELSEYWFSRKANILTEIDKFKAETLVICENFHRDVINAKSLAEKLQTSSNLEQNQIDEEVQTSICRCCVNIMLCCEEHYNFNHCDKELTIVKENYMGDLPNPEVQTIRCVQCAKSSSNAQINICVKCRNSLFATNNTWYEETFCHHISSKHKRIDEPVAVTSRSCSIEEHIDQLKKIFVTHFDKMSENMCKKMDTYFDAMRAYNYACKQILNKCIQIIWTGETYSSFIEKLSERCCK